jgi:AcrR family transcriptional regulator
VPRPKQRTPELRGQVLDVAVAMLAADGVAGFTTRKVAQGARTSLPAVYELFGDKAGLVRAVFFEGFRRLRARLDAVATGDDPRADLLALLDAMRRFVGDNRVLAEVMFSRPFADFAPGPDDFAAGSAVRTVILERVRRCIDAGVLAGDEADIAHVLMALTRGLAGREAAGLLGTSPESIDRRWALAFRATLAGLAPGAGPGAAPG